jgi:hypothetical protein
MEKMESDVQTQLRAKCVNLCGYLGGVSVVSWRC